MASCARITQLQVPKKARGEKKHQLTTDLENGILYVAVVVDVDMNQGGLEKLRHLVLRRHDVLKTILHSEVRGGDGRPELVPCR
jgi:hypothetical protein